ncbi:MAG TPA: M14 family metallopeptidase, partial [Bacteroidales bacterium]|nr:M14 family metallopeptidase [Bacteroidales bacterium]
MKSFVGIIFCIFLILPIKIFATDLKWATYCESTDYKRTPRYNETIQFCKLLAENSQIIAYKEFGISPQGRSLPLLIMDKDRDFTPEQAHQAGKAILMIQACIHPGEPEGKDAGLILFRNLGILGKDTSLLRHVTVIFIPIFNVDGHERFGPYNRINQNGPEEMGWRTTAQNLNLNRDFMKAEAPEMQAWLRLFNYWNPDFFIDTHTTDGADYQYALTYSLETGPNTDLFLGQYLQKHYIPAMEMYMAEKGYKVFPYVNFRQWHDPRSGLYSLPASAMLSHGYVAARNRPGLLIETHMLKPYKIRVMSTLELLQFTLKHLNDNYRDYLQINHQADTYTSSAEFRKQILKFNFTVSNTDSVMVNFEGYDYKIEESDLTGGKWFIYLPQAKVFRLPNFNKAIAQDSVLLPNYYIIPPEWTEIIRRLQLHGIKMEFLNQDTTLEVELYRLSNPQWSNFSFEGRNRLTVKTEKFIERRLYPAGSAIVSLEQPNARIIALLLEPLSSDSFLSWGFFNTVLEQKEYAETYVMENIARQMIQQQPELLVQFQAWKEQNPQMAKDQWIQLNWFYRQTPYFDQNLNKYPIGRISH